MANCPKCNREMFIGFMMNKMFWICIWCKVGVEK